MTELTSGRIGLSKQITWLTCHLSTYRRTHNVRRIWQLYQISSIKGCSPTGHTALYLLPTITRTRCGAILHVYLPEPLPTVPDYVECFRRVHQEITIRSVNANHLYHSRLSGSLRGDGVDGGKLGKVGG